MAKIEALKCDGCTEVIDEDWYPWINIPEMKIHTRGKLLEYVDLHFCKPVCMRNFADQKIFKPDQVYYG